MMHSSMQNGMGGPAAFPAGSWTHSFEEDQGEVEVYRPSASFPFPPARRGRETLSFDGGGAMAGMPGPDDRQQRAPVSVTALGMNRFRIDGGPLAGEIEVLEQSPEILRLRRR